MKALEKYKEEQRLALSERMRALGAKGGDATSKKGSEHFRKLALKSWESRRKKLSPPGV